MNEATGSLQAQCRYTVDILPGQPCQFVASAAGARGISESGTICGAWALCSGNGFIAIWTGQGTWQNFTLPPNVTAAGFSDVNDARFASGFIEYQSGSTQTHAAFFDTVNNTLVEIAPFPGQNYSEGLDINAGNVVCGYSHTSINGPLKAFICEQGRLTALELPFGTSSVAECISDSGFVCGTMGSVLDSHAFLWSVDAVVDLGTGVPGAHAAEGHGVNNAGIVCGFSRVHDPNPEVGQLRRGTLWKNGQTIDMGLLPGFTRSHAYRVKYHDVVIGYCDDVPIFKQFDAPFIWRNGVMRDVNDFIPNELNLRIASVYDLNNAGQIAGVAEVLDSLGDTVAVRLTPPQPPPGDCDCNDRIDMDDLIGVINQWGPSVPGTTADFDNNGTADVNDLMEVIRRWTF